MKYSTEHIGRGAIANLSLEIERLGSKNIFLVTGKKSFHDSGAKQLLDTALKDRKVFYFNDYTSNPTLDQAIKGAVEFKAKKYDLIIAVGGGSAIDIAKTINAIQAHSGREKEIATGKDKVSNELCPLIAIPTTCGTGSEATHFAVIYVDGVKYSLASDQLMPDVSIVDACFVDNLPQYISACTGFDALCQAVESYWSANATSESKLYASQAIKILIKDLTEAVSMGHKEKRTSVVQAAHLAGKAINISKTTAPHALSYGITKEFGLPHGHAAAITLGLFFELHAQENIQGYNHNVTPSSFAKTMRDLYVLLNVKNATAAKDRWYAIMKACGLSIKLDTTKVNSSKVIDRIIEQVNVERLSNHPIQLTPEMIRKTLRALC
ncbi:phosphonoacetaldehyde reductase [Sneathiella marina]|uniref:Phosphonoacetaldehyde reductase n=1 Tax=Sneathiella marina TaxID=2950108 RepID=A0ABY4W7U9_9PROT|nr:phosphonoacetaldehyde reductase [Sneathiella marina]USG61997.1 phosphonoacetaldehyde reductase [Sneathiella marina]